MSVLAKSTTTIKTNKREVKLFEGDYSKFFAGFEIEGGNGMWLCVPITEDEHKDLIKSSDVENDIGELFNLSRPNMVGTIDDDIIDLDEFEQD